MEQSSSNLTKPNRSDWLIPLAIFLIALLVRVIGLKFSFPLLTHHDERFIIDPLIEMSKNHTLDSGFYARPNQFLYTSLFGYLNLLSKIFFNKNFGWAYSEDPLFFYFHARLLVAVLGATVPVLAWKIGKLFKAADFSLSAAFLTCFYPSYIIHSHYITGDILNTALSLLVILFCLLYLQKNKWVWIILASITVALNTLEKYPGILSYGIVLVTLGINMLYQENKNIGKKWGRLLSGILLTLTIVAISMFLFAPHLFLKLDQVFRAITIEAKPTHLGADNLSWIGNMQFYLDVFINSAGWVVALFTVAGVIYSIISKQPAVLLLFFGAGYWVALSKLGLHWERWSLPMMITPLLLAALGLTKLWDAIKHRQLTKLLAIAFLGVFACVYALNGVTSSVLLTWKDTRVVALEFTEQNDITQENSVYESYTPFLPRNLRTIFDFDLDDPGQIQFVILSSNMYNRYEAEPDRYTSETAFYADLRARASLLAEFEASPKPENTLEQLYAFRDYMINLIRQTKTTNTTGPTIQIYELLQD